MDNIAQDLFEFLSTLELEGVEEGVDLEEAAINATAKFRSRMKANRKGGKRLPPSKYLKKYGSAWMNLKNEFENGDETIVEGNAENKAKKNAYHTKLGHTLTHADTSSPTHGPEEKALAAGRKEHHNWYTPKDVLGLRSNQRRRILKRRSDQSEETIHMEETDVSPKETEPKAKKLSAGEIAYQYIKKSKGKVEASQIRRAGIDGSLQSAESYEPLEELSKPHLKSYIKKAKEWLEARGAKKMLSKSSIEHLKSIHGQPSINNDRKFLTKIGKRVMSVDYAKEKIKDSFDPLLEGNKENKAKKHEFEKEYGGAGIHKGPYGTTRVSTANAKRDARWARQRRITPNKMHLRFRLADFKANKQDEIDSAELGNQRHENFIPEAKQPTAKGAAKWERKTKYRVARDKTRNLEAKKEERTSKTGIPHSSGHGVSESVKPAKGTKADKRACSVAADAAVPTMPAGMNAGMRMMAASFDNFRGDMIAELKKDTVYAAYKERATQAKAHHDIGDTEGAKKHAEKALKHADYHAGYEKSREKYAKYKEARAIIAKRAKKPDPEATKRLELKKRREARKVLYGEKKKNENAQ